MKSLISSSYCSLVEGRQLKQLRATIMTEAVVSERTKDVTQLEQVTQIIEPKKIIEATLPEHSYCFVKSLYNSVTTTGYNITNPTIH